MDGKEAITNIAMRFENPHPDDISRYGEIAKNKSGIITFNDQLGRTGNMSINKEQFDSLVELARNDGFLASQGTAIAFEDEPTSTKALEFIPINYDMEKPIVVTGFNLLRGINGSIDGLILNKTDELGRTR